MFEISVVLPFYNAEKTLERAINSLLNQTFKEFYIILVNNNSTDSSYEIAKKYSQTYKNIILLSESRQGVAFASNTGMRYAQTKYIARFDADDESLPERIEKQYKYLEKNPQTDLVGTCVNYFGDEKNIGLRTYVELTNKIRTYHEISINRFSELQVINPTIMFRKQTAEKFGYYEAGNFPEDYEFFLRWLQAACIIEKLPDYLLNWHDSQNRLTRTNANYSYDAFYKIKTPFLAEYLKKNNKFYPKTAIWGAGKISKKRSELLKEFGIIIDLYIDVSEKKIKQKNCIFYKDLPNAGNLFILSYVSNRGANQEIRQFLISKNYTEGTDFLIVS